MSMKNVFQHVCEIIGWRMLCALSDDAAFSTGLACSATVEVWKIPMHEAHFDAILQCQKIVAF